MNKVCIINGSSRQNSNTQKLAMAIKKYLGNIGVEEVSIPDSTKYDIPFFNQGTLAVGSLTSYQKEVYESISSANLIFFLSPEYNWTMSAEMLNLFHQFGAKEFSAMWNNKKFAFAGVSSGRGGRMPALDMNKVVGKIVGFFGFNSMVSPRLFESQLTPQVLDSIGNSLGNDLYDRGLAEFINYHLP